MNEENQTIKPTQGTEQVNQPQFNLPETQDGVLNIAKEVFLKIYTNKMLYWLVVAFLIIIFIIIFLGMFFGKKKIPQPVLNTPSPIPFIRATPIATPGYGELYTNRESLNKLKKELEEIDVKQGKLAPPTLNFDIKF